MEQRIDVVAGSVPATATPELWKAITEMARLETLLYRSEEQWVATMVRVANFRDDETPEHIQRMSRYSEVIARSISTDSTWACRVRLASQLHDIGKIAVPDRILLKMGELDPEERQVMQRHVAYGQEMLSVGASELAELAATIALRHHERWDGGGYPDRLAEQDIPIEARVVAIADTFDALTTNRIYRKAYSLPVALKLMREENGGQFDPELLAGFFDSIDHVMTIFDEFPDVSAEQQAAG